MVKSSSCGLVLYISHTTVIIITVLRLNHCVNVIGVAVIVNPII